MSRSDRVRGWLAAALGLTYAVGRLAPWSPRPLELSLDDSWRWVFHEAFRRGLTVGTELIFTAGPYGFLLTETYHPATYFAMLAIQTIAIAMLALSLWVILRRRVANPWAALAWLVLSVETIGLWDTSQSLFFHLGFALAVVHWTRASHPEDGPQPLPARERLLLHLLAAALALSSLVKFSYFTCAAVVIGALVLDEAGRRRRFPWLLVTFVAAWLALWLGAGQPLSAIGPYLGSSVEIASGFNAAMTLGGPLSEVFVYLVAAALLIGLCAVARRRERGWWSALPVGTCIALSFVVYKVAFVRHDGHALTPVPLLLPWCLVAVATTWSARRVPPKAIALAALAASVVYAGMVVPHYRGLSLPALLGRGISAWPTRIAAARGSLSGARDLRRRHATSVEEIRRRYPLPPLAGTVDLYPALQGLVLAHGLEYRPRPVMQSYSAYTRHLSEINAGHLAGERAADHILFTIQPLDGLFPAMDDGLSWPQLMARYDLRAEIGPFLQLSRSRDARGLARHLLAERTVLLGQTIPLPETAGKSIWATLELHPTLWHRLASVAFKPPRVHVAVRLRDGREQVYRLVPALAEVGFLLSPLVAYTDDYARLVSPIRRQELRSKEIVTMTIVGEKGSALRWAFRPELRLRLWELETSTTSP